MKVLYGVKATYKARGIMIGRTRIPTEIDSTGTDPGSEGNLVLCCSKLTVPVRTRAGKVTISDKGRLKYHVDVIR